MYKVAFIVYLVCLVCYTLFTRVPDYFDGDFVPGTVTEARFLVKEKQPLLVVKYFADGRAWYYKTNRWLLNSYKVGQQVTMIFHPSFPAVAAIYTFFGYWVTWQELMLTAAGFVALFIAAVVITGKNSNEPLTLPKKRKYND